MNRVLAVFSATICLFLANLVYAECDDILNADLVKSPKD